MSDYYLILDTESSGLPKHWNSPYEKAEDWPHLLQLSWVVCDNQGNTIKEEDHYFENTGFEIELKSRAVHKITDQLLLEKGEERIEVFQLLENDLDAYQPLIIGHFIELDYRLLGAEYFRLGRVLPFNTLSFYCTMKGARRLPETGTGRSWKLTELYWYFFQEQQPHPHNALYDARATARCFFKEKEVLQVSVNYFHDQQPIIFQKSYQDRTRKIGIMLVAFVVVLLVVVLFFLFT